MDVEEGVFYAIEWGDGTYGNVDVLKVDDSLVHIRLYPNTWPRTPIGLSPDELKAQAIGNEQRKVVTCQSVASSSSLGIQQPGCVRR